MQLPRFHVLRIEDFVMADKREEEDEEGLVITISVLGRNKGLIWNSNDVLSVRETYRIAGCFVGSLPRKPWQNTALSVPLLLMPEEATLLLQKGKAIMMSEPETLLSPSESTVNKLKEQRQELHMEQIRMFVSERVEKKQLFYDSKCSKRKKKKKHKFSLDSDEDIENDNMKDKQFNINATEEYHNHSLAQEQKNSVEMRENSSNSCRMPEKNSEISHKVKEINEDNMISTIPNENTLDSAAKRCHNLTQEQQKEVTNFHRTSLKDPSENRDQSISSKDVEYYRQSTWIHIQTACQKDRALMVPVNWEYPRTAKEKLNYKVFCDLWERGYHITSGEKFGCDYLVYPGDPLRFHSYFIVIILESGKTFTALELLAYGRLGTSVKKTVVIASEDLSDECYVKYQSLLWAGLN